MAKPEKENTYSHTVILPKTEFPMKADLSSRELAQMKSWKENKIFQKMKAIRQDKPRFLLHDGPPYANGDFHVGHSLNKILKDFILKSKLMAGFQSDMIPGWDCHGLPIEVQVLKNLGKKAKETSPTELRTLCREYAASFIEKQSASLSRFLCFWEEGKIYQTMSSDYEAKIVEVFGELFQKGYIYKGKKPVYWCISLATAHAEAEIEYQEHTSWSIYVKFPIENLNNSYCLIWTTTPWTLPANLGICFNPDLDYSLFKSDSGESYLIADGLRESVMEKTGIQLTKERSLTQNEISNLKFRHPFLDQNSIPLFGAHVTLDAGTGCVHTAPGHGADDYRVGLEAGLEPYSPVDSYGRYTEEFPLMQGVNIFEANPKINELLQEKGLLLHASQFQHQYPFSWRSKKPLIFRATPQWFFSIDHNGLRENSLKAIDKVKWIPDWGISRIRSMVETRPDWCLSRQRNWGVPIPSFTCRSCGHTNLNSNILNYFRDRVQKEGIEIWYSEESKDLLPPNTKCDQCGSEDLEKDKDILDVWFDSGVSHFSVLNSKEYSLQTNQPAADLYLEGSDQHRGWFQSSLWPSMALLGHPPYKSVLTHGYVLDEKGHAMSKSLGNVINPTTDIINQYGADILRLWVSTQDFRDDVKVGKEAIKIVSDHYRKIRNTFRYILGNTDGFQESDCLSKDDLHEIDRYYLSKLSTLSNDLKKYYENYQFHLVFQRLLQFCTVDLSQDYFEIIRDRMYCEAKSSMLRRSSSTALHIILKTLSIYAAPILSFTSEEVWQEAKLGESVFLEDFPDLNSWKSESIEKKWDIAFSLKEEVQKTIEVARQSGNIGKSLEAIVFLNEEHKDLLEKFSLEDLEMLFVVSQVEIATPEKTNDYQIFSSSTRIKVSKPKTSHCSRCWRATRDMTDGKDICNRCEDAIRS